MSKRNGNGNGNGNGNAGVVGLSSLFASASALGTIGAASAQIITGSLGAVVIAGAAGKDAEDIVASDVTLVTLLVDASSSIHSSGLEEAVREGQNLLVDALGQSRDKDAVLMALWTFNDELRVVHSYVGLDDVTRFDAKNYQAVGATRLYDTWCDARASSSSSPTAETAAPRAARATARASAAISSRRSSSRWPSSASGRPTSRASRARWGSPTRASRSRRRRPPPRCGRSSASSASPPSEPARASSNRVKIGVSSVRE